MPHATRHMAPTTSCRFRRRGGPTSAQGGFSDVSGLGTELH